VNGASLQLTNFCKELLLASTKNIPMLDLRSKKLTSSNTKDGKHKTTGNITTETIKIYNIRLHQMV
jgi:hypothetical protein